MSHPSLRYRSHQNQLQGELKRSVDVLTEAIARRGVRWHSELQGIFSTYCKGQAGSKARVTIPGVYHCFGHVFGQNDFKTPQ